MNSQAPLNRVPKYQPKNESTSLSPSANRTRRTENQLSRHPWLQETGVHGRQQGVEQREPDWWPAVLTLITRIEDGLTTQAIITVPSGRRNAKLDIEVCPADWPMAPASSHAFCWRAVQWNQALAFPLPITMSVRRREARYSKKPLLR
jgi:hypothetical protein